MKESSIIESSKEQTTILRESNDDLVQGIRRCLKQKGINPNAVVVAEWFPDDVSFEYGIIINSNMKVYQFGYDYFDKNEGEGEFSEWHDITMTWRDIPLFKSVEVVLGKYEKIT